MGAVMVMTLSGQAAAQDKPVNSNAEKPLEITADKTLEWHRNTKKYIARGNAKAVQGDVSIQASVLTADYKETAQSSADIYRITADQNVVLSSKDNSGFADKAVYAVDEGLAVMTGDNLRLVSPDQVLTARDKFEYWVTEGKLVAYGRPKIVRETDTLEADKMTAFFKDNVDGSRELSRFEAQGNVVITTPTEILTGGRGVYVADSNTAELFGRATIKRGQNILSGERAEINLDTNISKMHGTASNNGRVRGVFYPGSE